MFGYNMHWREPFQMKRFDYCTIIGRAPHIFKAHVDNVLKNAGLPRDLWNFHVIIYRNSKIDSSITQELCDIAAKSDIRVTFYDEVEGSDFETFLHNLYACWNLCQTLGDTPLNVRAGSDQAFSRDSFKNMLEAWDHYQLETNNDNVVMFHNLIECRSNVDLSRHILEDFGRNWNEFDEAKFQEWCDKNERVGLVGHAEANKLWGAPRDMPGLASNGRADGASWIQSKKLFKKFGPMPPRYANGRLAGLTGDIGIMEKMRDAGVQFYIIGNSTTYHISQGERNPK